MCPNTQLLKNLLKHFCVIAFSLLFFSCHQKVAENETGKKYASLSDSTSYVGIESCRSCHSDKYESYIKTGMGMSFDVASKKKSSAVFSAHDAIHDKYKNLNYHPFWKNDSLMVSEFRIFGRDTIYKRNEAVSWIVGSGQHTNSHLMNVNGYVYQIPATFYTQEGKWDLPPGFEGGFNSRFSRKIEIECMTCHNAYPKIVPGSENKFSFVPNGIDCERCHGPGGQHVKEKLAGIIVDVKKDIDYSIVNPAKLSVPLQLDICQRCHIQGNAVLQEGKSFLDFRPGMNLSDVMNVYMPQYKNDDNSHIMASHVERMKMSKCFIKSLASADTYHKEHPSLTPYKNAMTCVTCHDPHISVKSTDEAIFNAKCNQCHTGIDKTKSIENFSFSNKTCTETMKARIAVSDNCVKCHMPKNGTIDIPHVTTTDHWIRIPLKQKEIQRIKEFTGLVCINNSAAGNRSKGIAFLSYYEKFTSNPAFLDSAKKYINDDNKDSIKANFKTLIRWAFLKNNNQLVIQYVNSFPGVLNSLKAISLTNDDAWTAYRIGESFNAENDNSNAILFFQKAIDLAPYQLDFRNKLAGAQQDAELFAEARKNYEFILSENPEYVSAYVSLGFLILTTERDVLKAEKMYDMALALDPDNLQAFFNKAGVMLYLGKKKEASVFLNEVLKRDKTNIKAKLLLKKLS